MYSYGALTEMFVWKYISDSAFRKNCIFLRTRVNTKRVLRCIIAHQKSHSEQPFNLRIRISSHTPHALLNCSFKRDSLRTLATDRPRVLSLYPSSSEEGVVVGLTKGNTHLVVAAQNSMHLGDGLGIHGLDDELLVVGDEEARYTLARWFSRSRFRLVVCQRSLKVQTAVVRAHSTPSVGTRGRGRRTL